MVCGLVTQSQAFSGDPVPELGRKALLRLEQILPAPEFSKAAAPVKPPVAQEPDSRAMRHLRRGRKRFDEELWGEAIATLEKSLQFDPGLLEARILLARASLQHGNHGLAEGHLREVLKHFPRDVAAHQMLGEMAWLQDKPEEAIRSLRLALMAAKDDPNRPEAVLARLTLAMALHRQGYLTAAADQFEAYLEVIEHPTPVMTQYHELSEVMVLFRGTAAGMVGEIQTQLKAYDKAVDAYRRAIAESPDEVGLRKRFVYALARDGRSEEALREARKWLADFPKEANHLELLREVCDLLGKPEVYDREILLIADKADPATRVQLARSLLKRNKLSDAIDILEKVADRSTAGPEAGYLLARLYMRNNDFAKSYGRIVETFRAYSDSDDQMLSALVEESIDVSNYLEPARRLAEKSPDDPVARGVLGLMLSSLGQDDEALGELKAAVKLDKGFGAAFVALVDLYKKQKRWRNVIATADTAIANGVRNWRVYFTKGLAHDALSEIEEAKTAWLEAFRMDRRSADPLFHLAESAERRGDTRLCEDVYRRIVDDVDPRHNQAREKLVRYYLLRGRPQIAQEYFSDFDRLNQKGAAFQRCRALLELFTNRKLTGKAKLRAYQSTLRKIINQYPRDTRTYLDLATSHRAPNELHQALEYTNRALQIDPHDLSVRELRYDLQSKLLRFEDASQTVESLLEDRPRNRKYLLKLLEFADYQSDYDKLIKLLKQMLARDDLSQHHSLFTAQLILTHIIAGQFDAAADTAQRWYDMAKSDGIRQQVYLLTLSVANRHEEAVALAKEFLEKDSTNRALQIRFLTRLQGAERYVEAQQLAIHWLADEPDDFSLNQMLISLCTANKQWDDAIEIARTGTEQSEDRIRYELLLEISYRLAGRFDQAVDFQREKVSEFERRRKQFEGRLGKRAALLQLEEEKLALVRALMLADRFQEAEKIVNKLLRSNVDARDAGQKYDPDHIIRMRSILTSILQNTDRDAQAIQQMEMIHDQLLSEGHDIESGVTSASLSHQRFVGINNDLGYSWADSGVKLERAEQMIRFALAEDPRSYAYLDSMGWVFYKQGRFDEAIYYLRWALRASRRELPIIDDNLDSTVLYISEAIRVSDRDDPVIHDHLGDALYRAGEIDEARSHWKKALSLSDPTVDPPPDHERRQLHGKVRVKLAKLAKGESVTTAPVVGLKTATQPSSGTDDPSPPTSDP